IYHSYNQPSELWVTTNGGANWTNRTSGLPDSLYFTYIDVDDDDHMNAWVTVAGYEAGQHVYHTTDGGVNWNNITYNLPNLPTNCIVHEDNSLYNSLYIGTDIGVYYSNDTMTTWEPYYVNMPNVIVSDLNINYTDSVIYAATFGRGIWKTELVPDTSGIITGTEQAHLQNLQFELYPNPNNGTFNLNIENYDAKTLSLEIVNVMGVIVATDELNIVKGDYTGTIDYNLAPGMYFLKLTKGKQMKAIRFVVK
ncbi:MAG: T9SS type A sorting domain-containing protein, partial [Flavobacteriales bacterium]|nr:T9SS type A sorting domain-containing protein [Flavobacteriales bacterium]